MTDVIKEITNTETVNNDKQTIDIEDKYYEIVNDDKIIIDTKITSNDTVNNDRPTVNTEIVNDANTDIILNYGNTNIKSSDEIKSDDSTDDNIEIHTDDFINDIEDGIINLSSDDIIEDNNNNLSSYEKAYKFMEKTKKKYLKKIVIFSNKYINTKYLNTIFTVLFGSSLIILVIVLFSDLKPEMIPFKIVRIKMGKKQNLARQLSIFFTFISFITDNILLMRVVLSLSFGIGIIAMAISPLPLDFSFILWYFLILLINIKHVAKLCYAMRHITFDNDRELIYTKIFKKLMSRNDYQLLMKNSLIRTIKKNRYYVNVEDTCDNLTILISGKLRKKDKKNKTSYVKEVTFVDSPEFIMQKKVMGQIFNISFYAESDCKILIWPREMINNFLKDNKDLNSILVAALGIDVSYKVFVLDVLK